MPERRGAPGGKLFSCRIGGQWVGLPVEQVVEVVPPQPRTEIPLAPPAVRGLINLRGKVVTELDARRIAELPPREEGAREHVVIVESASGEIFGLAVDEVGVVAEADYGQFEPTPDSLPPAWRRMADGVIKRETDVMLVVNVERMLAMSLPGESGAGDPRADAPAGTVH